MDRRDFSINTFLAIFRKMLLSVEINFGVMKNALILHCETHF